MYKLYSYQLCACHEIQVMFIFQISKWKPIGEYSTTSLFLLALRWIQHTKFDWHDNVSIEQEAKPVSDEIDNSNLEPAAALCK